MLRQPIGKRHTNILLEGNDPPPAFFANKVYAVLQHDGRINVKLYPPDKNLSSIDPWYPKISYGKFVKKVTLNNSSVGWKANYPNTSLIAYYAVPQPSWSAVGDYTTIIENESLTYTGPRTAKTKRSPLLINNNTDGLIEISISKNGTPLSSSDIADISKDGTITFTDTIYSSDSLIATYYVKNTTIDIIGLNLNPYPGHALTVDGRDYTTYQKIGLPIYVYLLPNFCSIGQDIITESLESNVINYTANPEIFDTSSIYYNELAVLLGIVSCSGYVHPTDVTVIDARSYGGGAVEDTTESLFDIDYYVSKTYPEKGFVIIDVDKSDKDKEPLIREAIEKNIATGTIYKIRWV